MIRVWCDHCGEEIPRDTYAVVEITMGKRDQGRFRLHACEPCQENLREILSAWDTNEIPAVTR